MKRTPLARSSGPPSKRVSTFFDTADVYSLGVSEEITGRLLKEYGPSRDQLVIATKVFNPMSDALNDGGLSRKHILHSVDQIAQAARR